MREEALIAIAPAEFARQAEPNGLLELIRPAWQAKDLIGRVKRLIPVDPSSACQRLFNAAMHDMREKVVVAGVDIAREAAKLYKLPPVERDEDIENYSVSSLIDLAYRMGLLSRAEWRRVSRCYEIRRDLEHEDDEYEAGVEDCVYIFKTCVEVILSKDPAHLLRVVDVKQMIEQPTAAVPSESLLADYANAPQPRQEEILKFLVSMALDPAQSDILQQNAYRFLLSLNPLTQNQVKLRLGTHIQQKIGRNGLDYRIAKVAQASGVFPYLRQSDIADFFETQLIEMNKVGTHWTAHSKHGNLLRSFGEIGGLETAPPAQRKKILKYLVLTYLGQTGGYTSYGNFRAVYYSNSAAPLVEDLVRRSTSVIKKDLDDLRSDPQVTSASSDQHIARRFENLVDVASGAA